MSKQIEESEKFEELADKCGSWNEPFDSNWEHRRRQELSELQKETDLFFIIFGNKI